MTDLFILKPDMTFEQVTNEYEHGAYECSTFEEHADWVDSFAKELRVWHDHNQLEQVESFVEHMNKYAEALVVAVQCDVEVVTSMRSLLDSFEAGTP